jgi:hypothetical protein
LREVKEKRKKKKRGGGSGSISHLMDKDVLGAVGGRDEAEACFRFT